MTDLLYRSYNEKTIREKKKRAFAMTPKSSEKTNAIPTTLISPCGMNCRLCYAYIRDKNSCPGCRSDSGVKAKTVIACRIRNCDEMADAGRKYCLGCDGFPCARLKHLDKRYRTKYGMSMLDNLESIGTFGIRRFVRHEKERWTCPGCGQVISVHKPQCLFCGYTWHREKGHV